jgi:hypothetical protein
LTFFVSNFSSSLKQWGFSEYDGFAEPLLTLGRIHLVVLRIVVVVLLLFGQGHDDGQRTVLIWMTVPRQ